jgi:hypothetical protein
MVCRSLHREGVSRAGRRTHRASVPARLCARGRRLVVHQWTWANTLAGAQALSQPRIGSGAPAQPPGTSAGLVWWAGGDAKADRSIPCALLARNGLGSAWMLTIQPVLQCV